ncbi:cyclic nucleotide-binding domain-containing protein [Streptomyces prasinopilosus]|uniref:cyclic nucleotide-binding domain-containing protein n=1 Tax=Streptomyces prasinopilosus TaxID=67344 RepID=UPI0020C78912|nr:cyclic nucleotide-binding domain-containing protein [Streptomyces prasinopilosus]
MTSIAAHTGPGEPHWPAAGLLGTLPAGTRHQLIRLGRPVRFEGGERLLREGESGSYAFLLLSGWFKVLATTEDGREALLAVRCGGDIVGELACFDGQPRIATVSPHPTGPRTARAVRRCSRRRPRAGGASRRP